MRISMHVEIINDCEQWNTFVESCPTGNITQTWEWAELGQHLGSAALRLGALENGALVGAMLVIVERAPLLRRPYLYAPRGPVVADPTSPALAALVSAAREHAAKAGAFMVKVEPSVPDGDPAWLKALADQGFSRNPYATHPRRSWVLDITPDEETLLAGMHEKWRYNVRLAGRKGVTVREGSGAADLDAFYRLYRETANRDGIFIHGQQHYNDFLRLYGERDAAALLLAEYEGTPIAALIVARCGPVATYMFGASSNQQRNRMPNHLLQFTAMRWARARGCALYDFRAIAEVLEPDEDMYSLYTYKRGFGGYSLLTLETHDLPLSAPLYWMYRSTLKVKRDRVRRQHLRELRAREQAQKSATTTQAEGSAKE
jgi:lipid II:glycine glycyltransferase (peptidoglycan interpeptide bridge formation enzyme)